MFGAAAKVLCGCAVGCFEVEATMELGMCKNDGIDEKFMQLRGGSCNLCWQNFVVGGHMNLSVSVSEQSNGNYLTHRVNGSN